jgi:flagellar biogenesis protein FliO
MLKRAGFFAAGLVLLWLAVELMATPGTSAPVVHETDEGGVAFRTAQREPAVKPGMLVAVFILIGGVVLAIVMRKKSAAGAPTGPLSTLADMPITADQRLRLIRCGEDVLLVGITAGGVTVLEKYRADAFDQSSKPDDSISPAFADLLREAAGRYRDTHRN